MCLHVAYIAHKNRKMEALWSALASLCQIFMTIISWKFSAAVGASADVLSTIIKCDRDERSASALSRLPSLRDRTASRACGEEEISWTSGERPQSRRRTFVEYFIWNMECYKCANYSHHRIHWIGHHWWRRRPRHPTPCLKPSSGKSRGSKPGPPVSLSLAKADCRRPAPVHNINADNNLRAK